MAKFLITGGAGFIGSHLCEFLAARGDTLRVLDDLSTGKRENLAADVELLVGDAADPGAVREAIAGVDGVFHLAAVASVTRSNEDWRGAHLANQTATVTVLDAARAAGKIPVVYASSAATYGDNPNLPLAEDAAQIPLTAYGADKLGSELHGRVGVLVHGIPTAGLRFFNVFGPRQDPKSPYSGVISIFADRVMARTPLGIFGDGQQTRDFVYVVDVVRHLVAAMGTLQERPRALLCNVCTGRAVTVEELARTLARLSGWSDPAIAFLPARVGDIVHSLGDPRRAIAELGVRAEADFAESLGATLAALGR